MVTLFITIFRWSQIDDGVVGTQGAVNDEVVRGGECEAAGRVCRGFPLVQHKYHQAKISNCGINVVNVARW